MNAETLIKDSCTWLDPAPEFYLASLDWFNEEADEVENWPVCLLDNSMPAEPVVSSLGVTEMFNRVTVFFLHAYAKNDGEDLNHNPEFNGVRHTAVLNMRTLATELLQVLFKDTCVFKPSEAIQQPVITNIYNFMDMNLDGVQLTFRLKTQYQPVFCERHSGPKP